MSAQLEYPTAVQIYRASPALLVPRSSILVTGFVARNARRSSHERNEMIRGTERFKVAPDARQQAAARRTQLDCQAVPAEPLEDPS